MKSLIEIVELPYIYIYILYKIIITCIAYYACYCIQLYKYKYKRGGLLYSDTYYCNKSICIFFLPFSRLCCICCDDYNGLSVWFYWLWGALHNDFCFFLYCLCPLFLIQHRLCKTLLRQSFLKVVLSRSLSRTLIRLSL